MPQPSRTNCRTTFQFQLARPMPDLAGNSCTPALNSLCCASPRAGETPGLLEYQGRQTALAEGGGPSADGVQVPFLEWEYN